MTAVLDASAAVDMLVPSARTEAATAAALGQDLVAPSVIDYEVASVIRKLERAGQIPEASTGPVIDAWATSAVERVPMSALLAEVWRLRQQIWIADAFYVALAKLLACPLITSDRKLAAPDLGIPVIAIA